MIPDFDSTTTGEVSNQAPTGIRFIQRATAMTRCMTQAAPHHLPHDLSVQGGEMHHVQIKDQVDGIVLDGCSGMVWDGQNPGTRPS